MKPSHSIPSALFFLSFIASGACAQTTPPAGAATPATPAAQAQVTPPPPAVPPTFQAVMKRILPENGQGIGRPGGEKNIYYKRLILRMYAANGQQPLWDAVAVKSLSDALIGLLGDGLNPDDYRFQEIAPYLDDSTQSPPSLEEQAWVDVLLTEAYLRALDNLEYGKVDPDTLDADSNYAPARDGKDRSSQLLSWIKQGRIDQAFDKARPKHDRYLRLKAALSDYRKIKQAGGWPLIPAGKSLKPGKSDSRVPLLRRRLAITGDISAPDRAADANPAAETAAAPVAAQQGAAAQLPPCTSETLVTGEGEKCGAVVSAESLRYDEGLVEGVKKFQARHNMEPDGVIGRGTLAAMNVTVEARIDQLRLNMERQRWYYPWELDEYLLIDVAGFHVYWMKGQEALWQERVQVGQRLTKTPIFRDQIEHIIFNPTWSVPPGINRRTILPSLKVDPSYLDKKGYQLLDERGKPIDPYSVDWESLSKMPFTVRQPPGEDNALGLVKFMFPNKFSVFLHDTNHRDLFTKQERTTSNGCIRLRDPFYLAEHLLARQGWDRARIDQVLATGKTTQTNLEKPLPILIQYSTTMATEDEVSFREDIYKRDEDLLAALKGPFQLPLSELPKDEQARIRATLVSASASTADLIAPEAEIIGDPIPSSFNGSNVGSTAAPNYFDIP